MLERLASAVQACMRSNTCRYYSGIGLSPALRFVKPQVQAFSRHDDLFHICCYRGKNATRLFALRRYRQRISDQVTHSAGRHVEEAGTVVEDERANGAALDHCVQVASMTLEVQRQACGAALGCSCVPVEQQERTQMPAQHDRDGSR